MRTQLRILNIVALALILVALVGCAPPASDTLAQQMLRELAAQPGEPIGSARETRAATGLDGRLQKALDRLEWSEAAPSTTSRAPEYPSLETSLGVDAASLEQVAYELPDGSRLLIQSFVDASGIRALALMSAQ